MTAAAIVDTAAAAARPKSSLLFVPPSLSSLCTSRRKCTRLEILSLVQVHALIHYILHYLVKIVTTP